MGWWFGERHLTTSKKAAAKPEDVKGLKIRTMDTPVAKSAMSALGASTVPMAVAELYTAMQMGVVDGQENPLNIIYNRKFYEVQKHLTLTGHMAMNLVIIINEGFYQKLSPELRQLLTKAAMEAGDFQSELTMKVNKQNLQDLKDKGNGRHGGQPRRFRPGDQGCLEGVRALFREGHVRTDRPGGRQVLACRPGVAPELRRHPGRI